MSESTSAPAWPVPSPARGEGRAVVVEVLVFPDIHSHGSTVEERGDGQSVPRASPSTESTAACTDSVIMAHRVRGTVADRLSSTSTTTEWLSSQRPLVATTATSETVGAS